MKKILIVDDDPNIRLLFSETLKMDGYDVKIVSTGSQALQMIFDNAFNLVILDIKMPGIHGLEILRKVRENGNKIPIVICSAFEGMKDDISIKSLGISDYLVKPVDLRILSHSIKKVFAKNVTQ